MEGTHVGNSTVSMLLIAPAAIAMMMFGCMRDETAVSETPGDLVVVSQGEPRDPGLDNPWTPGFKVSAADHESVGVPDLAEDDGRINVPSSAIGATGTRTGSSCGLTVYAKSENAVGDPCATSAGFMATLNLTPAQEDRVVAYNQRFQDRDEAQAH